MTARTSDPATFYDRVWNDWGALDDQSPAAFHRRQLLLGLVRDYARSSRRVLEVGCGQGALLRELTREFPAALVHGSDVSEESLARARTQSPNTPLFLLDLDSLDFEDHVRQSVGQFDLIVCSEVLEHLHDDRLALERLATLLTSRGQLILSVPGGEPTRFDRAIGHRRHYTERDLEQKLTAAGFSVQRLFAWGFPFHTFYRWVVKWAARAAFPNHGAKASDTERAPRVRTALLSHGYTAFASALKPLYYLNRSASGPQLFAVACRP